MNATRIMITSGGGPGVWGVLYALRHLPGRRVTLLVNDPAPINTLGTTFADVRVHLSRASDPAYLEQLLAFCARSRVDVLIPVYDGELCAVAARRADFEQGGTHLLLPPTDVVARCVDKWRTHESLAGTDLLPAHALVTTASEAADALARLGYPQRRLCVRPVDQTGGRGFHILDANVDLFAERMFSKPGPLRCTAEEFLVTRRRGPEQFRLLISEYLEGEELGVDLLAEHGKGLELVIRRKAGVLLHGNPSRILFSERPGERAWVARLAEALGLSGLVQIDARYDGQGKLRLLEVNARPGAYVGVSCARVHLLAWAIDRLLGDRPVDPREYAGNRNIHAAMRVFADVLITPTGGQVLNIAGDDTEAAAHAGCLPGCASG